MAKQYVKVRGVGGGRASAIHGVMRTYAAQLESDGHGHVRRKNARRKA